MYTLYFSPGACSLPSHIALEESDLRYCTVEVNTRRGETWAPGYLSINPAGKVPALRLPNDEVLTEGGAILNYVADLVPEKALLPKPGTLERARAQEWVNYLASTVHPAFRPMFRPERLIGSRPEDIRTLQTVGLEVLRQVFTELDRRLQGLSYALGDRYSICDAYLLLFWLWIKRMGPLADCIECPNLNRIMAAVSERPAISRVLQHEGLRAAA
ncbi:MAG TPA: glutathione S-transferase N-terminal domain-containing protein [Nitrospira sp.]|nr:glutathione S-transferase N-terminal domain-containing protein [Nitrospira sp.]